MPPSRGLRLDLHDLRQQQFSLSSTSSSNDTPTTARPVMHTPSFPLATPMGYTPSTPFNPGHFNKSNSGDKHHHAVHASHDTPRRATEADILAEIDKMRKGDDTVDLSHKRILTMTPEVISRIRSVVCRLALSWNFLEQLPTEFISLNKLRYLNMRGNMMVSFPEVLCQMPALEILDISRNKLRSLPVEPGTMLRLRVLNLSSNSIVRLPVYFAKCQDLRILKLESNPIQWPPASVLELSATELLAVKNESEALRLSQQKTEELQMERIIKTMRAYLTAHSSQETTAQEMDYEGDLSDGKWTDTPSSAYLSAENTPKTSPVRLDFSRTPKATTPRAADGKSSSPLHTRFRSTQETPPKLALRDVRNKKSLPDLRQNHGTILSDRRVGRSQHHLRPRTPVPQLPTRSPFRPLGRQKITDVAEVSVSGAETERNSYFRRLSTLPVSSINSGVPEALLQYIDATRGLLFALSQVNTALRQYASFSPNDALSSSLMSMLEPTNVSTQHLINALDNFDSTSRKKTPTKKTILSIFTSSKKCVSSFAKVVTNFHQDLANEFLPSEIDPRFTRTLLLLLFGSIGEIQNSWQKISALTPVLKSMLDGNISVESSTSTSDTSSTSSDAPKRTRRNAGSFSTKDVEKGANMQQNPIRRTGGSGTYVQEVEQPQSSATAMKKTVSSGAQPFSASRSASGSHLRSRSVRIDANDDSIPRSDSKESISSQWSNGTGLSADHSRRRNLIYPTTSASSTSVFRAETPLSLPPINRYRE